MNEPVWRIAGRYRVLDRIGSGGMADVLRAHDELLDRDVAVKVFRSVPPTTPDTASGSDRQRAELHALARLNHPNLTTLYDGSIVGQDGPAYLVMELIDGPSLAQVIERGPLGEPQARRIGAQIADALAYVHAAGMVHRDVKPANILLGSDIGGGFTDATLAAGGGAEVRARLTDFGIVRLVGSEPVTRADMTLGSASYLAPEQARGSAVGPPADVYALGLTLVEALTGRRAFDGPPMEAVVARLNSDPAIPAGLPEPWPALLRAMTARDPAQRPPARRVAQALRGAESVTAPVGAVPAGTYDTAFLPRSAAPPVAMSPAASSVLSPGGPPAPPGSRRGAPAPDEHRRRVPVSLIAAGVLVVALIIAGVALALTAGGGSDPSAPPATSPAGTSATSPTSSTPTPSATQPSSAPTDTGSASTSTSTQPTQPSTSARTKQRRTPSATPTRPSGPTTPTTPTMPSGPGTATRTSAGAAPGPGAPPGA